jgi:uncharacterized membrane protein
MKASANLTIPKLLWSRSEIILEIISLAGLVFLAVIFTTNWSALPERIPTHFVFSGQPNAWGSKHTLLPVFLITPALYVLLTALNRFSRLYKYPVAITAENIGQQYRLVRILSAWMKAEMVWGLALLQWRALLAVARGSWPAGEVLPLLGGFVAVLLITIFWYLRQSRRAG